MVLFIAKFTFLGLAVGIGTHLDVQAASGSFQRIGGATPVTDKGAIPIPFLFQDTVQQFVVVAAVYSFPLVIRAHDGIDMCFIHSLLEWT